MRRVFHRKGHRREGSGAHGRSGDSPFNGLQPVAPILRDEDGGERTTATNRYFDVGVASDWNRRFRKTMEDSSVVILDYMSVPGCAFFGIFDGHAGAQCARACAEHLHELLAEKLAGGEAADQDGGAPNSVDVPRALASAFELMDKQLIDMAVRHSGSTALVAVSCYVDAQGAIVAPDAAVERRLFVANVGDSRAVLGTPPAPPADAADAASDVRSERTVADADPAAAWDAKRLSYDHRCSDISERRRVENAGGLVMNNRVNGMLAVTRSLGDLFMKSYVIGTPYTTDTVIGAEPEVLVLACDGLWDVCSDAKSIELAQRALGAGHSALESSEELLQCALQAYSTDNLTTMVVHLRDPAQSSLAGSSAGSASGSAGSTDTPEKAAHPPPGPRSESDPSSQR